MIDPLTVNGERAVASARARSASARRPAVFDERADVVPVARQAVVRVVGVVDGDEVARRDLRAPAQRHPSALTIEHARLGDAKHARIGPRVLADARDGGVVGLTPPRGAQRADEHVGAIRTRIPIGLVRLIGRAVRGEHAGGMEVRPEPADVVVRRAKAHALNVAREPGTFDRLVIGCAHDRAVGEGDFGRVPDRPRAAVRVVRGVGRVCREYAESRSVHADVTRSSDLGRGVFEPVVSEPSPVTRTKEHRVAEAVEPRVGRGVIDVRSPRLDLHPPHARPCRERSPRHDAPPVDHHRGHVREHRAPRPLKNYRELHGLTDARLHGSCRVVRCARGHRDDARGVGLRGRRDRERQGREENGRRV